MKNDLYKMLPIDIINQIIIFASPVHPCTEEIQNFNLDDLNYSIYWNELEDFWRDHEIWIYNSHLEDATSYTYTYTY